MKPILKIDLAALAENYQRLQALAAPATLACVVKANAYGLGMAHVASQLSRLGCRNFFVATPDEALTLRALLPKAGIACLNGLDAHCAATLLRAGIIPVINHLGQLEACQAAAKSAQPVPVFMHLDTAMNRLGLDALELVKLKENADLLRGVEVRAWMSHLATAEDAEGALNRLQLRRFLSAVDGLPVARKSLANSGGIFLGQDFTLDFVRPGIALYGGNPTLNPINPMQPVVSLHAPILQIRLAKKGESVGYGATHFFARDTKLATLGLGYADGFHRSGSNRSIVYIAGLACPVVGRVSMDLISVDVSQLNDAQLEASPLAEILGPHQNIDALAASWGSISYEVITSLGARFERQYVNEAVIVHNEA